MVRLEFATPGLQTQCSSHWAIQLKSYCWEGVEFIQLVYCIIIYLSFLNCDWLLIREVQWFHWTQELLVQVEKFTVRMPMVRLELATPGLPVEPLYFSDEKSITVEKWKIYNDIIKVSLFFHLKKWCDTLKTEGCHGNIWLQRLLTKYPKWPSKV